MQKDSRSKNQDRVSLLSKHLMLASIHKNLIQKYPYQRKPKIASKVSQEFLSEPKNLRQYLMNQQLFKKIYVFYVLCSHNTRDQYTRATVSRLVDHLRSKNYVYELEQFKNFFYKHKQRNFKALTLVLQLLQRSKHQFVSVRDLLKIPGVGLKSSSLIANEFLSYCSYPVIDVNVIKGARVLLPNLPETKDPDKFFCLLASCDDTLCGNSVAYQLASLIYVHRKTCLNYKKMSKKNCDVNHPCELCEELRVTQF